VFGAPGFEGYQQVMRLRHRVQNVQLGVDLFSPAIHNIIAGSLPAQPLSFHGPKSFGADAAPSIGLGDFTRMGIDIG
jgi:hypothetical protein